MGQGGRRHGSRAGSLWRGRARLVTTAAFWLLLGSTSLAQEPEPPAISEPPPPADDQLIPHAPSPLAFDRFFLRKAYEEEFKGTQIRVGLVGLLANDQPRSLEPQVRMKLRIPRLEGRLHLMVNEDVDQEPDREGQTRPQGQTELLGQQDQAFESVALQFILAETRRWDLSAGPGLRLGMPPEVYFKVQTRRKVRRWEPWLLKLTPTLYWFSKRGHEGEVRFTADRPIKKDYLFRYTSAVAWYDTQNNMDLNSDLYFYQFLPKEAALEYRVGVHGTDKPSVQTESYLSSIAYRWNLGPPWLFAEVRGALLFPREHDYDVAPFVQFRIEAIYRNKGSNNDIEEN